MKRTHMVRQWRNPRNFEKMIERILALMAFCLIAYVVIRLH